MTEAHAAFEKARAAAEADDRKEAKRQKAVAMAAFALKRRPTKALVLGFQSVVQQKLLLHRCVLQKIGVLAFLACNRLDRTFVFLSQPDKAAAGEKEIPGFRGLA